MSSYRVTFITPVGTIGSVVYTGDIDDAWRRIREAHENGVRGAVERWVAGDGPGGSHWEEVRGRDM